MIGFLYLLMALGCWTAWAVLSARLGDRLSPLNSLLWTGLISAAITVGGFLVHYRQVRVPGRGDWWLLAVFCVVNTVGTFGYYAALRHLPGSLVLPVSHLYLVFGPVLLALGERRPLSWQQLAALGVVIVGVVLFLAASPTQAAAEAVREQPAAQAPAPTLGGAPASAGFHFTASPRARVYPMGALSRLKSALPGSDMMGLLRAEKHCYPAGARLSSGSFFAGPCKGEEPNRRLV